MKVCVTVQLIRSGCGRCHAQLLIRKCCAFTQSRTRPCFWSPLPPDWFILRLLLFCSVWPPCPFPRARDCVIDLYRITGAHTLHVWQEYWHSASQIRAGKRGNFALTWCRGRASAVARAAPPRALSVQHRASEPFYTSASAHARYCLHRPHTKHTHTANIGSLFTQHLQTKKQNH